MTKNPKATKLPPINIFEKKKLTPIVKFYLNFIYAKQLYRAGWLRKGIPENEVERVAGHTEGVVVLSTILAQNYYPKLNLDHIRELAAFHELGESVTEDVVRHGNIYENMTKDEKKNRERSALVEMLNEFPEDIQNYYINIFDELRNRSSLEAQLVDDVDKLECCFQALIYEYQYPGSDLGEFFINVRAYINDSKLLEILDELNNLRKK